MLVDMDGPNGARLRLISRRLTLPEAEGAVLIDMVESVKDPRYFTDAAHMNVLGMRAKAVAVGEALVQLPLFSAGLEK